MDVSDLLGLLFLADTHVDDNKLPSDGITRLVVLNWIANEGDEWRTTDSGRSALSHLEVISSLARRYAPETTDVSGSRRAGDLIPIDLDLGAFAELMRLAQDDQRTSSTALLRRIIDWGWIAFANGRWSIGPVGRQALNALDAEQ
jgi:hypothetical protein